MVDAVFIDGPAYLGCHLNTRRTNSAKCKWLQLGENIAATFTLIGAGFLLLLTYQGRIAPDGAVDLAMPLGPGRYLVISGGRTDAINPHLMTLTLDRARAFRGQRYAVDIIGIDRFGLRANGISPADPTAYAIYGASVLAPCSGTAELVIDGVADMPIPQMDRTNMTDNSIMLDCNGSNVSLAHLAHLAPGSIAVHQGQAIAAGTQVGFVCNTGNTGEPHLHIHVQKALPSDDSVFGDPVWFTINGQFLVRNDIFVVLE